MLLRQPADAASGNVGFSLTLTHLVDSKPLTGGESWAKAPRW